MMWVSDSISSYFKLWRRPKIRTQSVCTSCSDIPNGLGALGWAPMERTFQTFNDCLTCTEPPFPCQCWAVKTGHRTLRNWTAARLGRIGMLLAMRALWFGILCHFWRQLRSFSMRKLRFCCLHLHFWMLLFQLTFETQATTTLQRWSRHTFNHPCIIQILGGSLLLPRPTSSLPRPTTLPSLKDADFSPAHLHLKAFLWWWALLQPFVHGVCSQDYIDKQSHHKGPIKSRWL